ncbi:MAG: apolipoprotein N-acyltransferase [Proteobacteria bacterium]|nr:apolipoprotein N-acyltransferase [Pseudomonadota bacterium]
MRVVFLRGWRADAAALLFGMLSALAFPPLFALPVLLVAIPGLLLLIDGARGPAVAARRGFWFGFGCNLVGLYWITEAILVEASRFWWLVPFAVPAVSAVLAVFVAAVAAVAKHARAGWPRVFALAGAWVLADLARQFAFTGFPWNLWGSVWEFPGRLGDIFIQPAAVVSVHGLTLATLLLAATPVLGRRLRVAGAALLAAWIGFGLMRLAAPLPPGPGITAVLVQGDVAEGEKWGQTLAMQIFQRYLALTRDGMARAAAEGVAPGHTLVIWPETASPYLLGSEPAVRQTIAAAAGGTPGRTVALIGAVHYGHHRRPRNSLFALTGRGRVVGIYDKWHLVPFGEYQPDWLPLPIQIVPGGGFAPGPGPRTLKLPGLPPVGPLICYEAIFPGEVIDERDRPAFMVNVTNDAWFGDSTGPRQHLAAARMRAVEEGLPLARAANTGISAVFDARGHQIARLGLDRAGVVVAPVGGALPATPFARFGLWVPFVLAVASLGAGWVGGRRRRFRNP